MEPICDRASCAIKGPEAPEVTSSKIVTLGGRVVCLTRTRACCGRALRSPRQNRRLAAAAHGSVYRAACLDSACRARDVERAAFQMARSLGQNGVPCGALSGQHIRKPVSNPHPKLREFLKRRTKKRLIGIAAASAGPITRCRSSRESATKTAMRASIDSIHNNINNKQ